MYINGTEVEAAASIPVFAVDTEGKICVWNQGAEHFLGYQSSQVLGRRCWKVLQGRVPSSNRFCDETCPLLRKALRGEAVQGTRILFRNAAGEMTGLSMSTLVVQGDGGKEIAHLLQST